MSDEHEQDPDETPEQAKRRQQQEDAQLQDDTDLRALMAGAQGRRFVWRIISRAAGTFDTSFAGEAHASSAFNEGRRSIGIALMRETQKLAPMSYVEMLSEALSSNIAGPSPLAGRESSSGRNAEDE